MKLCILELAMIETGLNGWKSLDWVKLLLSLVSEIGVVWNTVHIPLFSWLEIVNSFVCTWITGWIMQLAKSKLLVWTRFQTLWEGFGLWDCRLNLYTFSFIAAFQLAKNKIFSRHHSGVFGKDIPNQWSCCKKGKNAEGCSDTSVNKAGSTDSPVSSQAILCTYSSDSLTQSVPAYSQTVKWTENSYDERSSSLPDQIRHTSVASNDPVPPCIEQIFVKISNNEERTVNLDSQSVGSMVNLDSQSVGR